MSQQINLYQPIFRKQEKVLSAKTLLQAALVIIGGLMLVYAFILWQTRQVEAEVAQLERQRDQSQAQLTRLAKQFPPRHKDAALERTLAKQTALLRAKQQVVAFLSDRKSGNSEGFADAVAGLARRKPVALWLTEVHFGAGGTQLTLDGITTEPDQVPAYLQALSAEPALQGKVFGQFQMSRSEKIPAWVEFSVSSRNEGKKP